MPSLVITTRRTQSGPRYVVRYRLGGRAYPIVHGGSFRTMKEAKVRRDLIAGEIAAGRNPADLLAKLAAQPITPKIVDVTAWSERFLASRIDIDANTTKSYRTALRKAGETFGDRDPHTITADDVAQWVASMAESHKPGTVRLYATTLKVLLDYVGCDPNPARDKRVRMPKRVREEPTPPSREHVEAILAAIPAKRRLLFVLIEQGGLRLGEAVGLTWGDVDAAGQRLRLPRSATKRDQAR
jgi:integrase